MRLYSTRESAIQGEPSVLAIVETLAAMGISVWIGVRYGTWWHVVIGATIAPLMLIRTDGSCATTYRLYQKYIRKFNKIKVHYNIHDATLAMLLLGHFAVKTINYALLLFAPIAALICRIVGTVHSLWFNIGNSLKAIPLNFWRITIATDCCFSPEIIPRDDVAHHAAPFIRKNRPVVEVYLILHNTLNVWRSGGVLEVCILIPSIILFVVLAFIYRLSIKGTALVWLPLLWALKPVKRNTRSWKKQLTIDHDLKKPQVIAAWSAMCFVLITAKYVLWASRLQIATSLQGLREVIDTSIIRSAPGLIEWVIALIRPGSIPLWQVATLLNSLLGLFFWHRVRIWLAEYDHNVGPANKTVDHVIKVTFFFRRLLTCYIVACNLFIIWNVAKKLPVPEIGSELFPWV